MPLSFSQAFAFHFQLKADEWHGLDFGVDLEVEMSSLSLQLTYETFSYFTQVMLGSGDPELEDWMRSTESDFKDKFRGWVGFSVPVSHRITAGYANIMLLRTHLTSYKYI